MNIAVLASHEGTTLQAILDACRDGRIAARVALVVSNNADSGALRRARLAGSEARHLSGRLHPDAEELDRTLCGVLVEHRIDLVMLAGYMKRLGPLTLARFRGRIFNTHPALLPKFGGTGMYGMNVHRAVLAAGERTSGATVHLVDEGYDSGPVVAQVRVSVEKDDTPETLAARVQQAERALVTDVLAAAASGAMPLPYSPRS